MHFSYAIRGWRAWVRRACGGLAALMLAAALGACATGGVSTNRPTGEGYAGVGELVLRLSVPGSEHWYDSLIPGERRASVEIRYLGIDDAGRAVFERHDVDVLAGRPVRADAGAGVARSGPIDTRRIAIDLRTTREIHVQGKIIDVLEASPSGVVFRLY